MSFLSVSSPAMRAKTACSPDVPERFPTFAVPVFGLDALPCATQLCNAHAFLVLEKCSHHLAH